MSVDFVGAGWSYPLRFGPAGEIGLSHGPSRVDQAIRLILATYPGERPMRPRFGSRLSDFVFAPADERTAREVSDEVRRAVEDCEPRVEVVDVQVTPRVGAVAAFDIDIAYRLLDETHERNLVVPFYTIPQEVE